MSSSESEFTFGALQPPPRQSAVPADAVLDAVRTARAEAEAVRAETEAIRAEARAEGLAAGRAEAADELAPAAAALAQATAQLDARARDVAARCERDAVDLAFAIAEKILAAAVAVEPERVLEAIRGALRGLVDRERITVLVHPDDLDLVRGAMQGIRSELGGIDHCEVQAERRVGRGGAVIHTPTGDVDAGIETKLKRAREVVDSALRDA